MDTLRQLTRSVRTYLQERLSNPIYGAYLLAWCIINFRLLLVFAGDGAFKDKISYIDGNLYSQPWQWTLQGLVYPLLIAAAFVLWSPYVNRWITVFLRTRERDTTKKLLEIEAEIPLTQPEAAEIRRALLSERDLRIQEKRAYEVRLAEQSKEIELLLEEKRKRASPNLATPDGRGGRIKPADEDDENTPGERLRLFETDFVGVPQQTRLSLASRGISPIQAQALWVMRNGSQSEARLGEALKLSDRHSVLLIIDQLKGLSLIEARPDLQGGSSRIVYTLTTAGRQTLGAVTERGFAPPPSSEGA